MLAFIAILLFVIEFAIPVNSLPWDTGFHCEEIRQKYSPRKQQIDIPGAPQPDSKIILYWGSDPARAAAALFRTVIHDALGYQQVKLRYGPQNLTQLITHAKLRPYSEQYNKWAWYRELSAWDPSPTPVLVCNKKLKFGVGGCRLTEFGSSAVQVRLQLHVYIPDIFQLEVKCANFTQWSWYVDSTALTHCGFDKYTLSADHVTVYGINPSGRDMTGILTISEEALLPRFRFHKLRDRKSLTQMLQSGNQSFLFIDYSIWLSYPNVYTINLPSCIPSEDTKCLLEPDNTVAVRIADVSLLKDYAPRLFQLAYNFLPSVESLREILELESYQTQKDKSKDIESAACVWSSKHPSITDKWVQKYTEQTYEMALFHCANEPDFEEYDRFLDILKDDVNKHTRNANFSIELTRFSANCSDANYLKDKLFLYLSRDLIEGFMGAIIGGLDGIKAAIEIANWQNFPVILYTADSINTVSDVSTWLSTRHSLPLAIAFHHFILNMSWSRIAVISENTPTAKDFVNHLNDLGGIVYHEYSIPLHASPLSVENVLQEIRAAEASIVLINTNANDAVVILSAGQRLGMSAPDKYAWIIRERLPNNITLNVKHITISTLCQSGKDVLDSEGRLDLRNRMDELWHDRPWPAQAVALGDAVLTFVNGFKSVIFKYPKLRVDIHNDNFIGLIEKSVTDEPVKGIIQNLTYKDRLLEETLVFVDEWPHHQNKYKARWRINMTARSVRIEYEQHTAYFGSSPPHDGSLNCIAQFGDAYLRICYDTVWIVALVALVLVLIVIALCRCNQSYHYKLINKGDIQLTTLYKHKLAAYLVKHSELEIPQQLGSGQFSCKRLATLRAEGQAPQAVAIKMFCGHQVDSSILREACILASLKHDHVIRLVGIYYDNEGPLVLMEVGFFGDLLQYLQSRRYIVENAAYEVENGQLSGEAAHISTKALTRFACQAATALDYLSTRGVIHRDLRASNCIVDAKRSLKLTGFCMATEGGESSTEIPCMQQCGLKSMQWMAPESLLGDFTAASDIWAFGVLVFELITLGASPYPEMSSSLITKLVSEGGCPRLPLDASPLTYDLVQMCWRRDPNQRVTAAEIVTYLTSQPTALRPALGCVENRSP